MKKISIALAVLSAFSAPSFSASLSAPMPAKQEATSPMIVQLVGTLPFVPPDLSDARIGDKGGIGNLRPEVLGHMQRLEKGSGFKAKHGFSHVVKGFSADLTPAQVAQLKANPLVKLVEPDVKMSAVAQTIPYGISTSGATISPAVLAGDGLANNVNLSQVAAFVVDTGVALHPDLNVGLQVNYVGDNIAGDCNGHGTHVSGIIGAKDDSSFVVGVAPGVKILPLKVLDCNGSGYSSSLINAFDYAASVAVANPTMRYVLNASVGFPPGTTVSTLDTAVANAATAGVLVAVAAGNDGVNSCGTTMVKLSSGSSATGVMAIGAVDSAGREASFSSYGSCVALWAPGVSVLSTSNSLATATMSGTSQATPHVTGAGLIVRATAPSLTPAQANERLKTLARLPGTLSKDGRVITHLDISKVASDGSTPPPAALGSVAVTTISTLDFGLAKLRGPMVVRSLTIQNKGDSPLTVTGFSGLPPIVTLTGHNCASVAVGQVCSANFAMSTGKKFKFSAQVSTVGATQNALVKMTGQVQ